MDNQFNALLQMMQMMWQPEPPEKNAPTEDNKIPAGFLLQTFLPFMPPDQQQRLGAALQIMELQKTLQTYTDNAVNHPSPNSADWHYELLMSIRPRVPHQKQRVIDLLLKIIEINDILSEWEAPSYDD